MGSKKAWHSLLRAAVKKAAAELKTFTSDDVWQRVPKFSHRPDPRSLGAVLSSEAKEGHIVATGSYKKSARLECHSRPVMVWESRVFASPDCLSSEATTI